MKKYIAIIIIVLIALKTKAQNEYIPIDSFELNNIKVKFKLQFNYNKNKENRFIIDITNYDDMKQYKYLNFKLVFENQNNYLIGKNISKPINDLNEGENRDIEFVYFGYKIKKIDSVYLSTYPHSLYSGTETKIGSTKSIKPNYISCIDQTFSGTDININLIGGRLGIGDNWMWYTDTTKDPIDIGSNIRFYITRTTTFYVRAEENKIGQTEFVSKKVIVNDLSYPAYAINYDLNATDYYNSIMTIYKLGGQLGKNAKWVWYKDSCGKYKIGEGEEIKFKPKKHNNLFVRAEGSINQTSCAYLNFDYKLKILPYNFININYKLQNINSKNIGLMIGNQKYYLSINLDLNNFTQTNKQNLVSENYVLKNFDSQNSANANFTDQKYISNNSFLVGIMNGNNKLKLYTGIGYGMRNTYNQIDVHNANDGTFLYKNWVKNNDLETNGSVIQLGVFYRYKSINSAIGIESIKSFKNNNYFTDIHFGIGITLNKKK